MVRICFCVFDLFKAGSKTLQVLTLELCARAMLEFSASVWEYQALSDSNVIAVHCKGGKGRTGTMVCVCLIDSGAFRCVPHRLWCAQVRNGDFTTMSQVQFVVWSFFFS